MRRNEKQPVCTFNATDNENGAIKDVEIVLACTVVFTT